jgi:hypothetical protein
LAKYVNKQLVNYVLLTHVYRQINLITENLKLKKRVNAIEEGWKKQEFLYNGLVKLIGQKEVEMEIMRLWIEEDKKNKELEEERQRNVEEATRE